ncbi:hypothetical protein HK104_009823 [Borealophlyctis nickersoniae]|nr:hypothetical protein HK104_009823 [Borealophlyctis nickersoniae]
MISEIPDTDTIHQTRPEDVVYRKDDPSGSHFQFEFLSDAKFPGFQSKDVQDLLFKWGMQDHAYMARFTYDRAPRAYEMDSFLLDFFNDPNVNPRLKVLGTMDRWGRMGTVSGMDKEETVHTVTSLDFFDKLYERDDIIRATTGEIIKCLDSYHDPFLIADELRKCLLMPSEPCYAAFSDEDRRELIFHLFKALCLGGRLCQYEDDLEPYLETTRKIYKDLVSVTKDAKTGKLRVASHVYKINNLDTAVSPLFPIKHPQNFCYVSVDPLRRHVTVFYHASDTYY